MRVAGIGVELGDVAASHFRKLDVVSGKHNEIVLKFPAAVLAAGLDGIAQKSDPGKPLDIDMYAEGHKAPDDVKKLPLNLLDALRLTDGSALLRREFGDELVDAYVKLKTNDWNEFSHQLTDWERKTTLDC